MSNIKTVAVLALQGDFIEHIQVLQKLGYKTIELRQKKDLLQDFDAIVLPGGESTVQSLLLKQLDMFDLLKQKIESGVKVFATCAGLILLSMHLKTLPCTVRRNAYGRQLGSFFTVNKFDTLENVPMTFIRAPIVESVENDEVKILSVVDEKIVAVKYKNQVAISFHPELNDDYRIYDYFFQMT